MNPSNPNSKQCFQICIKEFISHPKNLLTAGAPLLGLHVYLLLLQHLYIIGSFNLFLFSFFFFRNYFFFLVICKMLWCLTTKKWSWLEEVYDEEESCQESETSCQLCKIITEQKICNHGNTLFLFTSITNLGAFWPLPQLLGVIMHCKKLRADVYLIIVVLVWLTALLSI
jgi:hypothetical protein